MFKEKVVIITGGTRGIGLATVEAFAKEKATVIYLGSKKESIEKTNQYLKRKGIKAKGYYPNLTNKIEIDHLLENIYKEYGHIDILINNAGMSFQKGINETTKEDLENVLDINLIALFNMTKGVIPYMQKYKEGVILNTSSIVSIYGQKKGAIYPASKAAVNGLTKSLAQELAGFNIRVNAVAPGVIKTDMVKNLDPKLVKALEEKIPLKRMGEPLDVAHAFVFLASPYAHYITGTILEVNGGYIQ